MWISGIRVADHLTIPSELDIAILLFTLQNCCSVKIRAELLGSLCRALHAKVLGTEFRPVRFSSG